MTLESGDKLFFDITPTGMVVQMLQDGNKDDDLDGSDRGDCDTVLLHGREVARLLWALRQAGQGVQPSRTNIVPGKLSVKYEDGIFLLLGPGNSCALEQHEMYMVLCALSTRVWRMFA